jgi:hypothetical protein
MNRYKHIVCNLCGVDKLWEKPLETPKRANGSTVTPVTPVTTTGLATTLMISKNYFSESERDA